MPVEGVKLTSSYGMRVHPVLGGRRAHKGIDLAGPVGTPIYATADGVISKAEWFSSYGLYVSIEHGGALQTRYGHMSRLNVANGQRVHKGDIIGFIGTTGRSTGPHLHYEVRVNGEAVNPLPYMQSDSLVQASTGSLSHGG
jgi:murein DD-endopeptidase MepM/ murein hydrolase activator NlpD